MAAAHRIACTPAEPNSVDISSKLTLDYSAMQDKCHIRDTTDEPVLVSVAANVLVCIEGSYASKHEHIGYKSLQ